MPKKANGELVPVVQGFDYSPLDPQTARQVKDTAERIPERVKRTVEDIIETGKDLLAAPSAPDDSMAHGRDLPTLAGRHKDGFSLSDLDAHAPPCRPLLGPREGESGA